MQSQHGTFFDHVFTLVAALCRMWAGLVICMVILMDQRIWHGGTINRAACGLPMVSVHYASPQFEEGQVRSSGIPQRSLQRGLGASKPGDGDPSPKEGDLQDMASDRRHMQTGLRLPCGVSICLQCCHAISPLHNTASGGTSTWQLVANGWVSQVPVVCSRQAPPQFAMTHAEHLGSEKFYSARVAVSLRAQPPIHGQHLPPSSWPLLLGRALGGVWQPSSFDGEPPSSVGIHWILGH
jgi:hypothetical protein